MSLKVICREAELLNSFNPHKCLAEKKLLPFLWDET